MHYQFQQGYLDPEYYADAFKDRVVRLAPTWRALGLTSGRRSFFAEIGCAADAGAATCPRVVRAGR